MSTLEPTVPPTTPPVPADPSAPPAPECPPEGECPPEDECPPEECPHGPIFGSCSWFTSASRHRVQIILIIFCIQFEKFILFV